MMQELDYILSSVLGNGKRQGKEMLYHCPFCHHRKPKLSINMTTKQWKCWVCPAKGGRILSLLRKLDVSHAQIQRLATLLADEIPHVATDVAITPLTLPEEFRPLWNRSYHECKHYQSAVAYVRSRGLSLTDVIRWNVGYCKSGMYAGRIIVPSYDAGNQLNYFVARTFWSGNRMAYLNPHVSKNVIGFENFVDWTQPIILTEGVFDAMAVKRNAVPLLGKTVSKKLQARIMAEGVKNVYLALDSDALKQTLIIAEKFMRENINVYLVEMSGKDPSEMGFVEVRHKINSARKLSFSDLIQLRLSLV